MARRLRTEEHAAPVLLVNLLCRRDQAVVQVGQLLAQAMVDEHGAPASLLQPVAPRRVFVCELWEGVSRRCKRRCNDPWGPCYCVFDNLSLYTRETVPIESRPPAWQEGEALVTAAREP